jgi:hypothetical protein
MSADQLDSGYQWAYREFYRWSSIARGASAHPDPFSRLRHFAYSAGWKKFEPLWDAIIRARRPGTMLPVLESILSEFGRRSAKRSGALPFFRPLVTSSPRIPLVHRIDGVSYTSGHCE